ncbi:MAG: O-methyltransferase [bacterium]
MYTRFELLINYLNYFIRASNGKGHGIHSPFVFDFVVNLLRKNDEHHQGFQQIEQYRKYLLSCEDTLAIEDLGAGSAYSNKLHRKVSSIASSALKTSKYARLLYRMMRYYEIDSVVELGTSLGVTTRYLSLAQPANGVTTIEGSPALADFVARSFSESGIKNVNLICGDFKEHLDKVLDDIKGRKLIFFDGNHQYRPTIDYFTKAMCVAENDDVFVFDDIHWSPGMEKAWNEICQHGRVTCSIDLFFMGVVFFKKEFHQKQHFTIRF